MELQMEKQKLSNGQLILVPHKDTIRLLEVYVKRSLSVNDGTLGHKRDESKQKWVTKKPRRHSSDPSLHFEGLTDSELGPFSAVEPQTNTLELCPEESEKETKRHKDKKPSFWKSIIGFFSRKSAEDKDEEEDNKPTATSKVSMSSEVVSDATPTCLHTASVTSHKSTRRKSFKRRFSKKRLSVIKRDSRIIPADIGEFEAVVSVEPTYSYYEKVSEEMEKIVHEVKEKEEEQSLSDEDVINRIIALTKVEGDAIDIKLKDNPTLSNFFQGMTYSSFQKLADAYLEEEVSPTHNPPTVLPTAPELVKLAFTLDFTARVASLSRQNIGHITSLGNHYLQDRFKYEQACTDHP
ncbi:uncharacterized protein LOC131461235 [Solea solea]|uniref:uncharacterized protein LOC131461235 n=1 Tax=Solea solea TaxID=90069 RepID=UPI00272BC4B7|nr:uncharacterized protein LOC131461235 [Solea solea]